jgi:hypothetical protein
MCILLDHAGADCRTTGSFQGDVTAVDGAAYTVKWNDGSQPSTVEAGRIIAE